MQGESYIDFSLFTSPFFVYCQQILFLRLLILLTLTLLSYCCVNAQATCNTLNIPQDSLSFCSLNDTLNIIFMKNEECDVNVVFQYDSSLYSLISQTQLVATFVAKKPGGSYIYSIINTDSGQIKDSVHILYTANDIVDLNKTSIAKGRIKNVLTAPKGFVSYVWDDGSTGNTLEVNKSGVYSVQFTDRCGNVFSDTIVVTRPDRTDVRSLVNVSNQIVSYPTAFSPNGDGKNDKFRPVIRTAVQSYQLSVYDPSGKLLFITHDVNRDWDGTWNGKPLENGTYVWKCSYILTGQPRKIDKGVVVLIR